MSRNVLIHAKAHPGKWQAMKGALLLGPYCNFFNTAQAEGYRQRGPKCSTHKCRSVRTDDRNSKQVAGTRKALGDKYSNIIDQLTKARVLGNK